MNINVTVCNLLNTDSLVIVNPANVTLRHESGAAKTIADAAGELLVKECNEYVEKNGPLQVAQPVLTTSGKLAPGKLAVMHVAGPNCAEEPFRNGSILAQKTMEESYYNCLKLADVTHGCSSIALPALSAGFFGAHQWEIALAAANAIKRFDVDTASAPGKLLRVELANLTLTMADVMSVVFRKNIYGITC